MTECSCNAILMVSRCPNPLRSAATTRNVSTSPCLPVPVTVPLTCGATADASAPGATATITTAAVSSAPTNSRIPRYLRVGAVIFGRRASSGKARSPGGLPRAVRHGLDQDLGHLRPAELLRRLLPAPEHLADLGPGEDHPGVVVVRTGLRRCHGVASPAEERVLEEQGSDPELVGVELLEDLLSVVRPVVGADAG